MGRTRATGTLLMVMDHDQHGDTPEKDRMRYKRGDIVNIYPPGQWYVDPPCEPWLAVEIAALPPGQEQVLARYSQMESVGDFDPATGALQTRPYRRRTVAIDLDALPVEHRADLASRRHTSIAWSDLRARIINKDTGRPED